MKYWISAVAIAFLAPLIAFSQTAPPPVSQPLVAEGTFAQQLASALNLGNTSTEAQAEDLLATKGIAPKNGWITDYPMTPAVIGEVRDAVLSAADAGTLSMPRDAALRAFRDVTAQNNLPVFPASGQSPPDQSTEAENDSGNYAGPDVVNNYYYQQGPPPLTYYPPPADYSYLYDWYPYPFYGYGSYFPGFYMLGDFAFFGGFGSHRHFFANHFHGNFHNHFHGSQFARFGFHNDRFFHNDGFHNNGFRGSGRIWNGLNPTQNRAWSSFDHRGPIARGPNGVSIFSGSIRGFQGRNFGTFRGNSMGGFRGGGMGMSRSGSMGGFRGSGMGMSRGGSMGGFRGSGMGMSRGGFGGGFHGGGFGGGHGGGGHR